MWKNDKDWESHLGHRLFKAYWTIIYFLPIWANLNGRGGTIAQCPAPSIYATKLTLPNRGAIFRRTLAIVERQSDLLSVICGSCAEFVSPPTTLASVSKSVILCHPLPLLISISPITHPVSSCFCILICPRNVSCRCVIIFINSLFALARCSTFSSVTLSVHAILKQGWLQWGECCEKWRSFGKFQVVIR